MPYMRAPHRLEKYNTFYRWSGGTSPKWLASMPMFFHHVIQAPKTILDQLDKLFNGFVWGDDKIGKKIHWA